ncbi:MAG: response regulator [Verrucomicrobiota bacterium]|jgi:CheY-like chemotaxis protein
MNNDCILYAEDDPNDAFFLQHAFDEVGIHNPLQIVKDGQEAIDYLAGVGLFTDRRRYPPPCLILLDLKMPRKSGIEVLAWIRAQPAMCCVPVLVLSASCLASDLEKASLLGANSYIIKPFSLEERVEFAQAIRSFWLHFHYRPDLTTLGK